MLSISSLVLAFCAIDAFSAPTDLIKRNTATDLIEKRATSPGTGTSGGYFYSFYNSGSSSSVTFNLGSGGAYRVSWSNCDNFVAERDGRLVVTGKP